MVFLFNQKHLRAFAAHRLAVVIIITLFVVSGGCARLFARVPIVTRRRRTGTAVVVAAFLAGRNDSRSRSSWHQQQQEYSMAKLESPSAERNKDPIWQILETKVFPLLLLETDREQQKQQQPLKVLEIAAGAVSDIYNINIY